MIADPTQTQPPLESLLTNYPKNCSPNLLRDTIQFHIAMSISPFAFKFFKNCMVSVFFMKNNSEFFILVAKKLFTVEAS